MQTYFDQLDRVRYEGPKSTNPLAFRHYNPDELVLGKRMEDHFLLEWRGYVWRGILRSSMAAAGRSAGNGET